ncbi:uncharacterized protein FTJAE_1368 [Fusarium tjaetaba]|uniref:F-box domain-containing protein n=1 Tax=Fusarium tjaetaba TaxID=1567544 RepID=A0A8H5W7T7_9HYPO|nr:uncharacterized protein FTJAE_1368 [Fusarium tjaetaba]KAF5648154.1 hypothetical protein FTJAE_1368 [Fusarium tjaetaba]
MVTLRSQTRAERASRSSWDFLPQEIRRMILEDISSQRRWSCASTVCKEWHAIVASKNLNRLELNGASAEGLKTIILQRHLIRRVYLNIQLPLYRCHQCPGYFPSFVAVKLIKKALRKLTKALATWRPTHHITLELNAYSPCDPEHCFKNHLYGFEYENDVDFLVKQRVLHDPAHGWFRGMQVAPPTATVVHQLFSTIIPEISGKSLSKVLAIKGVVIRRQMRRQIDRVALSELLKKFPNLESINYEPWRVLFHVPNSLGSSYDQSKSTADTIEEHAISTSVKRWLRHGRKLSAHVILIKDMLANATLINSFARSNEWMAK